MEKQKTPNQPRSSEKGFIMISLSVFIIVLMSVSLLGLGTFYHYKEKQAAKTQCVKKALKAQRQITEGLNQIEKSNKTSRRLYMKLNRARLQLVAALASRNPLAIQAAKKRIQLIQAEILALDRVQKILLTQIKLTQTLWRGTFQQGGPSDLAVVPTSSRLAPEYRVKKPILKNFSIWKYGSITPHPLISKFAGIDVGKGWNWRCGSSIEKRGKKWEPRLVEAKLYWNLSPSF